MTKDEKNFIKERYVKRFKTSTFSKALKEYNEIEDFASNGNINDTQSISDEAHYIMRLNTQYHLTEAFKSSEYQSWLEHIIQDKRYKLLRDDVELTRIAYNYIIESKGKFYIGSRLTNNNPEEDIKIYMSSSKYKHIFINDPEVETTIISTFNIYRDALLFESFLHNKFNVKDNPLFWNEGNQTPWGFEGIHRTKVVGITEEGKISEYASIASTGIDLNTALLSPFTKQINKGIRYMYKKDWEENKENWNYSDYIYDVSSDSSRNIPVVRISKDGDFIREWNSAADAIRDTGLSSIEAALQRIDTFFVGNSIWLYKDEYIDIQDIKSFIKYYKLLRYIDKRKFINIKQLDKNKNIINSFDTLEEATEATKATQIRAVLKGKQETSGGYYWTSDLVTDTFRENLRSSHNIDIDVKKAFIKQFGSIEDYYKSKKIYEKTKPFAPNGNIFETDDGSLWDDKVHFIMRWTTGNHLREAFKAMKIDLDDPNVTQDLKSGNIGTFQRIAKVWTGFDTHDDMELGGGRWSQRPRLASFPNNGNNTIPITKRVDIISNCSHHFIPFTTIAKEESYAVISYIPAKKVLGISKLQRVANWVSQRFFLQEDLTKMLYDEVSKVAETDSVYVGLFDMVHGCESMRGARANDGTFTSEYYGGAFKDAEVRKQVKD